MRRTSHKRSHRKGEVCFLRVWRGGCGEVGVGVGRCVCMYVCAVWACMVCVGVSEKA